MSPRVRTGLQRLLDEQRHLIRGARVALLANHTSVDEHLQPSGLLLSRADDLTLARVLAPEHGPWGTHQDMEDVPGGADPVLKQTVVSLYGADERSLSPDPQVLDGVDVLIFDIQDIGARYYTYVYTLLHAMQVAGRSGVRVVVCDRPNPIGGDRIEGNLVSEHMRSFVGRWPLPNRHGLTAGELARLFNATGLCELDVVPMEGWRRDMGYADTGLPWVAPSPNMPRLETAALYPGLCLLEGTNLSEGRGTTLPFELFGAPWLDASAFAQALNASQLPGVRFRPTRFRPMFQKHAGVTCNGVQAHITDYEALRPVLTGLRVIQEARALAPGDFDWRRERYEFVSDRLAIDLLAGTERWREQLEAGISAPTILKEDRGQLDSFRADARKVMLYD